MSVFVDESGNFGDPNDPARLCIVTLVLHDQSFDISRFVKDLDRANYDLGLDPECPVVFAQGARQEHYKLLQVADLICTAHLIEQRLLRGHSLKLAESRFFGGARDFKRNILKKIKAKEL